MLFHLTNALAFCECAGLAVVLLIWADKVAGARLLTLFLAGVCLWIAGNELPGWAGPAESRAALWLLCSAPLSAAVFVMFAVRFSHFRLPRGLAYGVVLCGVGMGLAAGIAGPGSFRQVPGLGYVAFPNSIGWAASLVWAGLAAAGHAVLLRAWQLKGPAARRQITAIGLSSAMGAVAMSGYGIIVLGLPMQPWPLALLPAYPVALVYGILRYRVFIANAWAQRAVVWSLLTGLAVAMVIATASLPVPADGLIGHLLSGSLVAASVLALTGPARWLAGRLIYPGGTALGDDLTHWRAALRQTETLPALAARAQTLLAHRLAIPLQVLIGHHPGAAGMPLLRCVKEAGVWQTSLTGWEAAPPGPRRLAGLFGALLADEAERLERAAQLAERERDRQTNARLAELGALAATVAHDVRNPLNIIAMAAAGAAPELRAEITGQVNRIARLTADLLDYAKPWTLQRETVDLSPLLSGLAARYANIALDPALPPSMTVQADPKWLRQAIVNVLDNAAACGSRGMIHAAQQDGVTRITICDDGPGIADDIKERLFEPFVSRTPGGTGLGLAIVARVLTLHGGSAALTTCPGWSTCFVLSLPS